MRDIFFGGVVCCDSYLTHGNHAAFGMSNFGSLTVRTLSLKLFSFTHWTILEVFNIHYSFRKHKILKSPKSKKISMYHTKTKEMFGRGRARHYKCIGNLVRIVLKCRCSRYALVFPRTNRQLPTRHRCGKTCVQRLTYASNETRTRHKGGRPSKSITKHPLPTESHPQGINWRRFPANPKSFEIRPTVRFTLPRREALVLAPSAQCSAREAHCSRDVFRRILLAHRENHRNVIQNGERRVAGRPSQTMGDSSVHYRVRGEE